MIIYPKPIVINKGVEVMKKEYVIPVMVGERFAANEYVAICWGVACSVGNGNYGSYGSSDGWAHWNGTAPYGNDCHNHTGSCSQAAKNQFKIDDDGKVYFYAEDNDQQGSLNGGYTSFIDGNNEGNTKGVIDGGDTIFCRNLRSI